MADKFSPGSAGTTKAPFGSTQQEPGVAEQQYDIFNKSHVFDPTRSNTNKFAGNNAPTNLSGKVAGFADVRPGSSAGQDYWKGVAGKYDAGGPGYAQDALQELPANMDGYYSNALKNATRNVDKSLSARGQYGSSAGVQQIGQVSTDLAADQAKAEATYGLQRFDRSVAASGDERAWTGALGSLAFGAGAEDLGFRNFGVDSAVKEQGLANDAYGLNFAEARATDDMDLQIAGAGMDASSIAQGARDGRIQTGFTNALNLGHEIAGGYGELLTGDAAAAGTIAGTQLGAGTDEYNIGQTTANSNYQAYLESLKTGAAGAANIYGQKPVAAK